MKGWILKPIVKIQLADNDQLLFFMNTQLSATHSFISIIHSLNVWHYSDPVTHHKEAGMSTHFPSELPYNFRNDFTSNVIYY